MIYIPECEWNSVWFNIYPDPDCGGFPCSTSLLHVYAFKNANPGTCYLDSSLQLGSIFFETHGNPGQFYPLSFYWDSCFDNSFSQNFELDTFLVSNKVFDYNEMEITDNLPLPSFTGAPDDWLPAALLTLGELFNYNGDGHLLSAEVAFRGVYEIPVVIQKTGSSSCCYHRGNADGINGPGGPVNVADLVYLVNYLYREGSAPVCIEEGNADGVITEGSEVGLTDLIYLVEYLFKSGSNPPACP